MADLITGLYYDRSSAEEAVDKIESLGYRRDDISVIMHDRTRAKEFAQSTGTTAGSAHKAADAVKGAAKVGGALAAILAGAAAVNAMRRDKSDDRPENGGAAERTATAEVTHAVPRSGTSSTAEVGTSDERSSYIPTADLSSSGYAGGYGVESTGAGALPFGNTLTPRYDESQTGRVADELTAAPSPVGSTSESQPSARPFMAGPLAAVLLPALGAGLLSAFSKAGIPKEHAERYAQGLESGGIVVGVQARSGDEIRVRQILHM